MENVFYGLLQKDRQSYERFEVEKTLDNSKVKIKKALENEFFVNSPIARVVFGTVVGDKYCFRVRDDATELQYIICYTANGEKHFKLIDFHKQEEINLA